MLRVAAVTLALQLPAQAQQPPQEFPRVGPDALRDSGHALLLRHMDHWGALWRAGKPGARREWSTDTLWLRTEHVACIQTDPNKHLWRTHAGSAIRSLTGVYAVCPTWITGMSRADDERLDIDAALLLDHRDAIRAARADVIERLTALGALLPTDDWLVGQRVRLFVDQEAWSAAESAAAACAATRWWCAALQGYVAARQGNLRTAETLFAEAVALQPSGVRCEWTDAKLLLDSAGRAAYTARPCAARASTDAWLWWLSDPLWTEPGNERRLEQHVRQMLVAFREQLGRDERFDWRHEAGGDALKEMVKRYGWPSYLHWNGVASDAVHSVYLNAHASPTNAPYTTFEYSRGRIHAVPSWRAIARPLTAVATDWELRPPPGTTEYPGADSVWWPREHFAPAQPVVQLPPAQVAFLRRGDAVVVAIATDLDTANVQRAAGDSVRGHLVLSDAPEQVERIGDARGIVGQTLVGYGAMRPRTTLLGLEFPANALAPAARTRFAITAPASLANLAPGEYAISDPIVLRAPSDDGFLPNDMEGALPHMATAQTFERERIGVYLETYGLLPSDTVEMAVWVERYTPQGVLRQLGNVLRLTADLNSPSAVSWVGPQTSGAVQRVSGTIPILGRSVVLDLSQLTPGEYWLDVAVAKPGRETVRGRRSIVIQ